MVTPLLGLEGDSNRDQDEQVVEDTLMLVLEVVLLRVELRTPAGELPVGSLAGREVGRRHLLLHRERREGGKVA